VIVHHLGAEKSISCFLCVNYLTHRMSKWMGCVFSTIFSLDFLIGYANEMNVL